MIDLSWIQRLADRIALAADPHGALDEALAQLTPMQLTHIRYDWPLWARSKQMVPQGNWKSFGLVTGIGFGKTRALSEFVTGEAMAGRAMRVGLCAQNEDKTYDVMVDGKSGLLAVSPPWFRARFESGRIIWPNGAEAFLYTPEVPGAMRGPEHDLVWMSELCVWPSSTRDEALGTFQRRARLGYGKVIWDTSPKKRHPLLGKMLARSARDPAKHIVVNGTMRENTDNLTAGYVDEQYAELGGTLQGKEELDGVYVDDDEDSIFRSEWFDKAPRPMPATLKRRIISVDPAITSDARYSDATGIVEMGLGVDEQVYAIRNMTGVHRAEVWSKIVLDAYLDGDCDLVWIETNRGGDSHVALLRVLARDRGLSLVEVGPTEKPTRRKGVLFVRQVNTRGKKSVRAEGAAALLERGRVSFVKGGVGLGELRERLCAFDGTERTPDNEVDAFVHGCHELAELGHDVKDPRRNIVEATAAQAQLQAAVAAQRSPAALASLLPKGRGWGSRI